jgi:hypothetical protein
MDEDSGGNLVEETEGDITRKSRGNTYVFTNFLSLRHTVTSLV